MTTASFHYYLPAFLLEALRGSPDVQDAVVASLDPPPPDRPPAVSHMRPRLLGLTLDERAAVERFLRWLADAADEQNRGACLAQIDRLHALWSTSDPQA